MAILSVGTAFPPHCYRQEEILAAVKAFWTEQGRRFDRIEQLYRNTLVGQRHLALPLERYADLDDWGEANDQWIASTLEIGAAAIEDALTRADLDIEDVDDLLFVSTTGIATPSPDALLMNRLDFRRDLHRLPLFGLGCAGGVAGLARAADLLAARPEGVAVLLAVELCSLTLRRKDLSVANAIGTGLFSDGAAAAVLTGTRRDASGPRIVASRSVFYPDTEDIMGWDISSSGFGLRLSPDVPKMADLHLREDVDVFLRDHGIERSDIARWICHPGGPKVLEAIQRALELEDEQVAISWDILRTQGNLSSATVLLVLQRVLDERPPAPGSFGLVFAFGPAFATELVLLQWPT